MFGAAYAVPAKAYNRHKSKAIRISFFLSWKSKRVNGYNLNDIHQKILPADRFNESVRWQFNKHSHIDHYRQVLLINQFPNNPFLQAV
jgi:hypothetical protein